MNWHVLVIMQSFISHRFLFIGNLGKSLKNWPSHLTTTGFFSTWLGVGEEYFHIFVHPWFVGKCWKERRRRRRGTVTQPHGEWVLLPPSTWGPGSPEPSGNTLMGSGALRFGPWLMRQALQRLRRGIFCSRECSQIRAGCESAELSSVTGRSSRLLPCCQRLFKYLCFWQQFSFTTGLRKTRPWASLLSFLKICFSPFFFFFYFFFFNFFFFFSNRQFSLCSSEQLPTSLLLQDVSLEESPFTLAPIPAPSCVWHLSQILLLLKLPGAGLDDPGGSFLIWDTPWLHHFLCSAPWNKHAQATVVEGGNEQVCRVSWRFVASKNGTLDQGR